jgi:hypothetical protein
MQLLRMVMVGEKLKLRQVFWLENVSDGPILCLPENLLQYQVAFRALPRSFHVSVAGKNVNWYFHMFEIVDQDFIDDLGMSREPSQVKDGPFLSTSWKVKVKDFHAKLHQYFVDHLGPLYCLQLASPGGYVKRSPQLLVFTVRLCTRHNQTLSDRSIFGLIFVEDIHDKVERCVSILINHVDLGVSLDEQVYH